MPPQHNDEELRLHTGDASEVDAAPYQPLPVGPARPRRALGRLARLGVPALAAATVLLVLLSDAQDIDHDLQVIVPTQVVAGEAVPLRALLYANLRGIEGLRLAQSEVHVELRAAHALLAQSWLHPARAGSGDMEGSLQIPRDLSGPATVHATARIADSELSADAALTLGTQSQRSRVEGRALRALQHFAEGPIQANGDGVVPALRTRVVGGACVPELPCSVLVYVGEPAASVWAEANSTLTPSAKAAHASQETAGVVSLSFVTHGPEAELWLRASRGGQPLARRSVRLPIAMASDSLQLPQSVWPAAVVPSLQLAGGAPSCIVDVFQLDSGARGAWLRTGSLPSCASPAALPMGALPHGVHRLQARTDPFSTDTSAVRVIYVRNPGESETDVLSALAGLARTVDAQDPCVLAVRAQPTAFGAAAFEPTAAYLAALLEIGLMPLPRAVSGYPQSLGRLRASQSRMRALALCALGLSALALTLAVGRRGLWASARASEILVSAGQDAEQGRRARLRRLLAVIASVLALLLVFVVVGLYILARGFLR
jgi:hypothetical protein